MSTDPTKQPAPPSEEQADTAAPPTVQTPAQPAGGWGQEPPTRPVPQWPSAPPPPPGPKAPPPPGPTADRPVPPRDSPVPPTQWDRPVQPTQWDAPAQQQRPTFQQRPPEQQQPTQQAPQQWQQPQSQWQREPQDTPPPQWSPQPPQAQGQWPPVQPSAQPPAQGGFRRRGRKRKVRRSVMALFAVIVVLILLVIGDRVALAVTENQFADQFQKQGFPVKPSVSIEGFPFLTQLAAKDFNTVNISANDVPAGPVTITSLHATINGMHISSYSSSASAKVDKLNANAFISFGALAAAGGLGSGSGITVTPDGTDKLKISAGLGGVFTDTEEAQIKQSGPQKISVKVLPSSGPLGSLLSSFGSFSFSLPKGVPASLKITGLTLNSQGLNVSASATNATFSQ
jgi:LmeA-like phospholipid-binding